METMTPETFDEIEFAGTCDLAIWCKLLHDKGWTGPRIARAIAKSEGYVNNLIRVVERASPAIMLRWRVEQSGMTDHVCATDWLVAVCLLPHDQQQTELQRRLERRHAGVPVAPANAAGSGAYVAPNPAAVSNANSASTEAADDAAAGGAADSRSTDAIDAIGLDAP